MFTKCCSFLLAATIAGGLSTVTFAQYKPNPAPMVEQNTGPDVKGFADAYSRANDPKILVLVGVAGNPGRGGADAIKNLDLSDPNGDCSMIQGEIEQVLIDAQAEVVDAKTIDDKDKREYAALLLQGAGEAKAIQERVQNQLHADIVLMLTLRPGVQDAKYRCTAEILQAARGRKVGSFTFDWKLGSDVGSVKTYASAITRKFFQQFTAWYAPRNGATAERYTVRLVAIPNAKAIVAARNAFRKIPGVLKVTDGAYTQGVGTSVGELTIQYAGTPLDLMVDLSDAAKSELGMAVEGTDGNSGTITLTAHPPEAAADAPVSVEAFQKKYVEQGSPKIAVIINRQLTDQDRRDPQLAGQVSAGTQPAVAAQNAVYVMVNSSLGGSDHAAGTHGTDSPRDRSTRFLDARHMEDCLYKRLLAMKLVMVDPTVVRDNLAHQSDVARVVYSDDELSYLIGHSSNADIVIHGYGRVDQSAGQSSVTYTFRAVRVNDGITLAAESWKKAVSDDADDVDHVMDMIADYATAKLTGQMLESWTPPSILSVKVANCTTPEEVFKIMNTLKENLHETVSVTFTEHQGGAQGGLGTFVLRYKNTFEEMLQHLTGLEKQFDFDIESNTTSRNDLTIKLKNKL